MRLFKLLPEGMYDVLYGGDKEIQSLMINSKRPSSNAVFFAAKGKFFNGADFIMEAKRNGAVAVVMEGSPKYYISGLTYISVSNLTLAQAGMAVCLYDANNPMPIKTAVTGTNGKTSFVMIASEVFNSLGRKSAYTGTLGTNVPGFSKDLTDNTTFPPAIYAKILNDARKEGFHYVFSEVSSQGISMGRVHGIEFEYAIFMNLTEDHLDYHTDMESYYQSKKLLFAQSKKSLANISDAYGKRLYKELKAEGKNVSSFAIDSEADFMLNGVIYKHDSTEFTLESEYFSERFVIPMIGEHNAANASLAISIAFMEGLSINELGEAMERLTPVKGRLEKIYDGAKSVYIDYAHTPDALAKSIIALKEAAGGTVTVIFGCGGDRETQKRPIMGKIATDYGDFAIITTDNPRSENPNAIIAEIVSGISPNSSNYIVIPDREKAIEYAISSAKSDSVLIAGKGHEEYIIIGNEKVPFSDRDCVSESLN